MLLKLLNFILRVYAVTANKSYDFILHMHWCRQSTAPPSGYKLARAMSG